MPGLGGPLLQGTPSSRTLLPHGLCSFHQCRNLKCLNTHHIPILTDSLIPSMIFVSFSLFCRSRALCMAYFRRLAKAFYGVFVFSIDGGGHIMASPANLNMSPPLRPIPFTSNSMYLFMANAITSAPS
jgi:hypothetical protein